MRRVGGRRRRVLGWFGAAIVVAGMAGASSRSGLAITPAAAFTFTPNVRADAGETGTGQNEPQVAVDQTGAAYTAWQSSSGGAGGASAASRTTDGVHFTYLGNPDAPAGNAGDTALATTSWTSPTTVVPPGPPGSQGVMFSELGGTQDPTCPQGSAINIRADVTTDQGAHWTGADATCQAGQVDRNWIAAYTEPQYRGTPQALDHTWVYQEYHDFAVSQIWVTVSADGGRTWDRLNQHVAEQPGPAFIANACNTTPGGIAVDQRGQHAGRVYVSWTTSDAARNVSMGCNITEAEPFDHVYMSYSDDHGATWTTHVVWNDPCAPAPPTPPTDPTKCGDDQEIFTPIAVDDAGNVFVSFVDAVDFRPTAPQFDIAVAWSTDGGNSWSGGTTDHPGVPRLASRDVGTHYFPWIVAAGNGAVDVIWYGTPYVQQMSAQQKPAPAPGSAVWDVYMGQSLDVVHGSPFVEAKVSDHSVYFGDICTVGIFCGGGGAVVGSGDDRIVLDDIAIAIGPDGGARLAWTDTRDAWKGGCLPGGIDDSNVKCQDGKQHVYFSCQTGGTGLHNEVVTGCGQSVLPASLTTPTTPPPARPARQGRRRSHLPATGGRSWLEFGLAAAAMALVVRRALRDPARPLARGDSPLRRRWHGATGALVRRRRPPRARARRRRPVPR